MLNVFIFLLGISGGIAGFMVGIFLAFVFNMHEKISVMASGCLFAIVFALSGVQLARKLFPKIQAKYRIPCLVTATVLAYDAMLGLLKFIYH